jgi:hypothetical protein
MAAQTLSTADAVLKDLYRGPIIEQINYKTYMLDMIQRDSESVDFTGRRWVQPVHSAPNFSEASIADGGTLPAPGAQGYQDAIDNIKYHAKGLEITDMAIKQATGNEGAFVNLLQEESKRIAQDHRKALNRQVFGDSLGTLAVLATSPAGATTFTVDSTQYLKVGQIIDVRTISTGALENAGNVSLTITAINRTTKVVTVSANVTATTTTAGVYMAGSYGLESPGLRTITGTSRTLHGINSATAGNEFWNGKRQAASGAIAGEGLFEQLADSIGAEGNGEVEIFLTSRGIRRRLADTYQSAKRFNDARAVQIHGGYTAIFVNEIPVVADDDVPKGWAFALNREPFRWFQIEDPDWLKSEDGTVWHIAPGSVAGTRKASWQAWFVWYAALGCLAPNRTGAIPDALDDSA